MLINYSVLNNEVAVVSQIEVGKLFNRRSADINRSIRNRYGKEFADSPELMAEHFIHEENGSTHGTYYVTAKGLALLFKNSKEKPNEEQINHVVKYLGDLTESKKENVFLKKELAEIKRELARVKRLKTAPKGSRNRKKK